jgi:translation initiation factor 2 alpha subunit (eIF-2alpha)
MQKCIKFIFCLFFSRNPSLLNGCGLDETTKQKLLLIIWSKLTPKPVIIRAQIEVSCFSYAGIEAIKKALKAGISCSTEDIPIKINLIAPPRYGNCMKLCFYFQLYQLLLQL